MCPGYNNSDLRNKMLADLSSFLQQCPHVEIAVMSIQSASYSKTNVLQMRGKMPVNVAGNQRAFGFKFMLPPDYPKGPPIVYLDENENPDIVEMLDYLDKGNIITN